MWAKEIDAQSGQKYFTTKLIRTAKNITNPIINVRYVRYFIIIQRILNMAPSFT